MTAPNTGTAPSSLRVLRFGVLVILLGGLIAGVVLALQTNADKIPRALSFASAVMIVIFVLLELSTIGRRHARLGWTSILIGADGRVSTSKITIWLWTLGLTLAFLYLAGISVFVGDVPVFGASNWDDYLILLGGPFAAGILAKYAVVTKLNNGTLDKSLVEGTANPSAKGTPDPKATTGLSDAVSNDAGGLDVVDTQYFLFNIVAFVYASGVFIANNFNHAVTADTGKYLLPTIPGTVLALTGASAATYVGNKAVQTSGPKISTVAPSADVRAGSTVVITGVNLVPAGTPSAEAASQTSVWLTVADGTVTPLSVVSRLATPTSVTFIMPPGFGGKTVDIVVVSAGAIPSASYPIRAS